MPLCCGINIFIEVYVDSVCSNSRTCRPFIALGRSSSGEVDESTGLWRPGETANDYAGRTAEAYVNEALRSLLEDDEYLLENLLVPFKNGHKNEIDAALITRKGISCIETKPWIGSISGSDEDEYWLQAYRDESRGARKHRNQVEQNRAHCNAMNGAINKPIKI